MEQILMQEQLSFQHKMTNIQNTNSLLDQLQRKMNSYFNKTTDAIPKYSNPTQNDWQLNEGKREDNLQYQRRKSLNQKYSKHPARQMGNDLRDSFDSEKERLQFKLYNQKLEDANNQIAVETRGNDSLNRLPPHPYQQNQRSQQQKLGDANSRESNMGGQNRSNSRSRKSNDQFRLIGKSKQAHRQRETIQIQRQQSKQIKKFQPQLKQKKSRPAFQDKVKQYDLIESLDEQIHNLSDPNDYKPNSKGLLNSMHTIQIVMKEALDAKLRKIKQIQQQIMTENEERVYLYKVNVRLNEQLKILKQEEISKELVNTKNIEWSIKTYQEDIEKAKRQLLRKKNERKQLRKQQQTLKDGYQTVLNNKKNLLKRDIESFMDRENKNRENTEMLKGLMKQLDKLKGVVQSKIKTTTKNSSVSQSQKHRKVIKSFKN